MGFLFVKSKKQDTKPQYTGLQVQTSSSALPVPILMGTNALAPNIIWYDNFKTIETKQKQGGKGGGSVTSTTYSYTADVILAICEGPISSIPRAWIDKSEKTLTEEGLTLFVGNTPQDAWPYLTTNYSSKALSYNGLAYVAEANYPLTDSAGIQNHNFEVMGPLSGSLTGVINAYDADVALAIQMFLTNTQFGTYFPSAYIDKSTLLGGTNGYSLQCYCKAIGIGISPAIASIETAANILERWLSLVNSTAIWSDGLLKFIPYGEDNVTGNGFTWTARTAPVYDLTDDDFVAKSGDDPVLIERIDVAKADNIIRLEISDRSNRYSKLPVESRDECAIQLFGTKVGSTVSANELCDANMAAISGSMMLGRGLYIRNRYKFGLSWEYCLLEPMDVVTLTDTKLGLSKKSVRIVEIEEDENGQLKIIAEDLISGLTAPTLYPKQAVVNVPIDQSAPAPNVNTPLIFEAPAALTGGAAQIWLGASGVGGNANWGGCQVWVSTDNATFTQMGTINQPATQGVLTASLADFSLANPDTTNTLAVNLSQSAGSLSSTSATDANAGVTAAVVDSEVLSHQTATLTGTNAYNLTTLYRGQFGNGHAAHSSGARYCRLDDAILKMDLPAGYVGKVLYVKFVSFNQFGQGLQDISTLTAYTFTPSGIVSAADWLTGLRTGIPFDLGNVASVSAGNVNLGAPPASGAPINLFGAV